MAISTILWLAFAFRGILLIWGGYQDSHSSVKYTDIDYNVFTDAARYILQPATSNSLAQGPFEFKFGNVYDRDTYRYTPLLAILLTPNFYLPIFGKLIFAGADLIIGWLLYSELLRRKVATRKAAQSVGMIWLLNPIIANISTRGSAESLLGLIVVSTLILAQRNQWNWAAVLFGLAVHFKIYPIIYGSSLFVAISSTHTHKSASKVLGISKAHVQFGLISFGTFMILNGIMYSIWGQPFIQESYLYHISRLDHRHNFSPNFYSIYLSTSSATSTHALPFDKVLRSPLASFVPQFLLSIGAGFIFGKDLPFSWFIQTFAFVTFNKVCTSQYFLWYLWFLPLILPSLEFSNRKGVALLVTWIGAQALWLSQAFKLEMMAESNFRNVWMASVMFLIANCWILGEVIESYRPDGIKNKAD